jgi:hypothetical protein
MPAILARGRLEDVPGAPFNGGEKRGNVVAIQSPIEEAARVARPVTHGQESTWRWRFCSMTKTVKAAFRFFTFSEVRDINTKGAIVEAACWAGWPQLGRLLLGDKIRMGRAKEEWAARVSLGWNQELGLGCQKIVKKGFGIFGCKIEFESR